MFDPQVKQAPSQSGFFTNLSNQVQQELAEVQVEVNLRANQFLFHQGDEANAVYVVQAGTLEVSAMSEAGKKLSLNILRPGELFGENALSDGGLRTASVSALESSVIAKFQTEDLFDLMRRKPDVAIELMKLAIKRFQWVSSQLETFTFLPLNMRLARRILHLSGKLPDQRDRLFFSQVELAEHSGATREAVANILAVWKSRRLIETGRGHIRILDHEGIKKVAYESELETL